MLYSILKLDQWFSVKYTESKPVFVCERLCYIWLEVHHYKNDTTGHVLCLLLWQIMNIYDSTNQTVWSFTFHLTRETALPINYHSRGFGKLWDLKSCLGSSKSVVLSKGTFWLLSFKQLKPMQFLKLHLKCPSISAWGRKLLELKDLISLWIMDLVSWFLLVQVYT